MQLDKTDHYNAKYRKQNYFGYREWLYDRYVSSLIGACDLKQGASVLDVGCGQGLFSYLFRKHGMNVWGIDISEVGIHAAQCCYGHLGITFAVSDIETAKFPEKFDCVFVRGLSLYNQHHFPENDNVTRILFEHVRPSGVLVFVYHTNFSSKRSDTWRYHSWHDFQRHFIQYPKARMYFSTKIDAFILGKYAFTTFGAKVNVFISKMTRRGGDFICILNKSV
jgi:2-polyprenyl-3-methyl-5-hydroxy-6-metoxy-1,4-benzoquinol methylase